jgi:hypothetical protein
LDDYLRVGECSDASEMGGRLRPTRCCPRTLVTLEDAEAWQEPLQKFGGEVVE